MNAVAERGDDDDAPATPSEAQLLDVLYELLAQGIEPGSSPSRAEIERFLHEHARERKSEEEMRSFFATYGLPTEPSQIGADRELAELASDLQRERGSVPPRASVAPSQVSSERSLERGVDEGLPEDEVTARRSFPRSPTVGGRGALVMAVALVVLAATLGLSVAFYLTYRRERALATELAEARALERAGLMVRTQLEQTTERLQRALEESERALRAETARREQARADEEQRRKRETLALQRVLGQHYAVVQRRLAEALAKSPR